MNAKSRYRIHILDFRTLSCTPPGPSILRKAYLSCTYCYLHYYRKALCKTRSIYSIVLILTQFVTQAFGKALGIKSDIAEDESFIDRLRESGLKMEGNNPANPRNCSPTNICCNDVSAVMYPIENVNINRTIKSWSRCSLKHLIRHINMNGGTKFCLFRMKNSKSCSCKYCINATMIQNKINQQT